MRKFLFRRHGVGPGHAELRAVDQPTPLSDPTASSSDAGMTVNELSELEARALCAREGIAVFWPRPERSEGA
jgi:hypothetical protein